MSPGRTEKLNAALKDASAKFAEIKLRAPVLPAPRGTQEETGRKYPVFQELAGMGQEIQDEFSRGQLELADIRGRLEGELMALAGAAPEVNPAPAAVPPEQAARPPEPDVRPLPGMQPAVQAGPAPGRRSRLLPALALAVVICAAAGIFFRSRGGPVSVFPLPPTKVEGLCLDPEGRRVFFTDPQRQLLFTVSAAEGRVDSVQSFPAAGLKALAYDGSNFWSSDGAVLARHGQAANYAVLAASKAAAAIAFLSWDGQALWAAGPGGELLRYSAAVPPLPGADYPMPGGRIDGISVSDGKLWVFDRENGKLSCYKIGTRPELLTESDLKRWLPAGAVTGFALGGNYAWLAAENPPQLLRVKLKKLGSYK